MRKTVLPAAGKLASHPRIFALAVLTLLVSSVGANAQALCRPVHGQIAAVEQTPPTCTGQFCSVGTFSGGIRGDYVVATTLLPDSPHPDVYFYTGETRATVQVYDQQGELFIKNTGVLRLSGELTELETITGGTGALAAASGVLFVSGSSGAESGRFTYDGTVCVP